MDLAEAAPTGLAVVTVHDPEALAASRQVLPELLYADNLDEVCKDADVVLHLTEWKQFREIDPAKVAVVVANPAIDGRNALDPPEEQSRLDLRRARRARIPGVDEL